MPSVAQLAKLLKVTRGRSKVVRAMMLRLKTTSPDRLAQQVVHEWRTRHGVPLQPSTKLTYVTAVHVAAQFLHRDTDKFVWRRLLRGIKAELSEHIARRAVPCSRHTLLKAVNHPRTKPDVASAMILAWLMGLRAADMRKIQERDVTFFPRSRTAPYSTIQVRARGLKG